MMSAAELIAAFGGLNQQAAGGGAPKAFEWTLGDAALQALVDLIPNEPGTSRDEWVTVAHGIMGAGGGFEIFDSYASRWGGYDADDTRRLWEGLSADQVRSGGGVLRALAEAADPSGFDLWKSEWEVKGVFDDGLVVEAPGVDPQRMVEAHQLQVADEIVRRFGDEIRFNTDTGLWHVFNSQIWAPVKVKVGFQHAAEWARAAAAGGTLSKSLHASIQKAGFYDGVEAILRQHPLLVADENSFDQDPWLLGTPGGTVDLKTGLLRKALAGDMISKCTLVTPSEKEDCPFWEKKLIGWMTTIGGKADPEMAWFLKQWAGYCLCGDTSEEKALFLYGDGANGKGSYVDTLAAIAGTYFVQPVRDLFMAKKQIRHAQEIAVLAGARMVSTSEVPPTGEWDEVLLKEVTGGGTMSANFMRQNQFSFRVRFKVTISGNDQPTFSGRISQAIRRRFLLATFPNVANPIDPGFKPGLMKEAPGILRWAINGLVDMHKNGGLLIPVSVQSATDRYLDDEDLFGGWLRARVQKMVGGHVVASDLMADWIEHRNREGNHVVIDSQRKFGEEMRRRGFVSKRTNQNVVYEGIVLKTKVNPF